MARSVIFTAFFLISYYFSILFLVFLYIILNLKSVFLLGFYWGENENALAFFLLGCFYNENYLWDALSMKSLTSFVLCFSYIFRSRFYRWKCGACLMARILFEGFLKGIDVENLVLLGFPGIFQVFLSFRVIFSTFKGFKSDLADSEAKNNMKIETSF